MISTISKREELRVVGEEEGWLKVEFDGKTGYVSKQYTTTEEPTSTGKIVCIDAGHQRYGDSTKEPNGPGSSSMKARVTGGTSGRTTGVSEYELNLDIALKLQEELEARGYEVVMTRTSHDVNISNKERAEVANSAGADITIRIHANGSDNTGVSGALTMAPSSSNPYCSNIANESYDLSRDIIDQYCAATGMKNQGVTTTDTMTGINWCQMPVTIIEMGYMTNATDDTNMQDPDYQSKMVIGIANGVDAYFGL
ncbi:MAG: N-acetylmuramoyl-L-alanine amidase [Lachnospiraceae bacterium]|nr:N-acetylmuramoyl-L-alanine amidase [Lachnospiraceae bacterium]